MARNGISVPVHDFKGFQIWVKIWKYEGTLMALLTKPSACMLLILTRVDDYYHCTRPNILHKFKQHLDMCFHMKTCVTLDTHGMIK